MYNIKMQQIFFYIVQRIPSIRDCSRFKENIINTEYG